MSDSNREKVIQQLEELTQDERIFLVDYLNKLDHKSERSLISRDRLKIIESHLEKLTQVKKLTQDERILLIADLNKLVHIAMRSLIFRDQLKIIKSPREEIFQLNTKWQSSILRSRLNIIKSHREEIFQLATKYGASNIKVFANDQGNNENGDNEVDFLVDLTEDRSLLDLGGLLMDLRELLGFDVFVFTEKTIKDIYRDRILQEALPL